MSMSTASRCGVPETWMTPAENNMVRISPFFLLNLISSFMTLPVARRTLSTLSLSPGSTQRLRSKAE